MLIKNLIFENPCSNSLQFRKNFLLLLCIVLGEKMSYITLKCKNCGSGMTLNTDSKTITCTHCGSTFMLADVMDEKDTVFAKKTSVADIETKMAVAKALKQGDTCVYQAEYKLAEEYYKKAIELDEKNYKGYFGVVRAKTSNFNRIPDSNDYLEYAKVVEKLVSTDDNVYVKSELSKLELLKKEKHEQKVIQENLELKRKRNEANKRSTERFFAEITYFLILFLTAIILVCVFMTGKSAGDGTSGNAVTYEISTKDDLINLREKSNYLSSTIILKKDIDFGGGNWTPIGTKENPFTGKFYGNSYKLTGIKITDPEDEGNNYIGLFGYAKNALLSGIKLDNVSFESDKSINNFTRNYVGLVCGSAENTEIKRCEMLSTSFITISHKNRCLLSLGGVAGELKSCTISKCYSNANIDASVSDIKNSSSSIKLNYYFGGIVGYAYDTNIINSYSKCEILTDISSDSNYQVKTYIAGIAGYNYSPNTSNYIKNCYFAGKIDLSLDANSSTEYVAGIVGYGATQNIMSENYVLDTEGALVLNEKNVASSSCNDNFSNNCCQYISSEKEFTEKIIDLFPASDWSNTSSLSPELL